LSNQNYEAILIGEVSGNWSPTAGAAMEDKFAATENN
jgi:hypothetical protein